MEYGGFPNWGVTLLVVPIIRVPSFRKPTNIQCHLGVGFRVFGFRA